MNVPVVQFGKYRGKSANEMLKDEQYLDWCRKQPDLVSKHQELFNYINKNSSEKSPEKKREQPLNIESRIQKLEENIEYQRKKLKSMEDELKTIKTLLIPAENQTKNEGEDTDDEDGEDLGFSSSMKEFLTTYNKK